MRLVAGSLLFTTAALAASQNSASVTFNKDVLPILQKECQTCHRPGEAAPMSFLTYQDTRPWAKAIRGAVLTRKMPPWFADPKYGHFANERKLSDSQIATLAQWADTGALEGPAKDRPAPVQFVEGWNVGQPDKTYQLPKPYTVPAEGTIEYTYYVIPTGFTEDTWVRAAELRPSNRAVVHHAIVFVRPPGSSFVEDAVPGEPYVPVPGQTTKPKPVNDRRMIAPEFLIGYAPGLQAQRADLPVGDVAQLVPAGSDLVLQMHYTAKGKVATDQTKVGLVLSKTPPKRRFIMMNAKNLSFRIPAGDSNYEVKAQITLQDSSEVISLLPHMHLRGKDFEFRAVYPTGESETLLRVPKYDFNWQLAYEPLKPISMPKGTRIECTAHFDNSTNNPANPNPNVEVRWGDQSWEEMMVGFFGVVIDAKADPAALSAKPKAGD